MFFEKKKIYLAINVEVIKETTEWKSPLISKWETDGSLKYLIFLCGKNSRV